MKRLEDKVAIVTGGTSGIGRACAVRFAQEGAHVVVAGRRREAGEAVAASLGGRSQFVPADVSREEDVRALVETTLRRFGRIDCVVSNAGSVSSTGPIADTDPKAFDDDLAVHVRAPFFAKAAGASPEDAERGIENVEAAFAALLPTVQAMPGMIQAEDIAAAAVFLASDEARFVNGHDLIVDGGITAGRPAATMKAA